MRIIYLSKNMINYDSALYQRDVINEFAKDKSVIFYGPGFKGFEPKEAIEKTIKRFGGADYLIVGHSWLYDLPGAQVDIYPDLHIEDCSIKKAIILNKEYVNLDAKLNWISNKGFSFGFSHNHDVAHYKQVTGVPFKFWPFGFNESIFNAKTQEYKDIDFAFSGILKNINTDYFQSDTRILVMNKFFHCAGSIPLIKKKNYKNLNIFWNTLPPTRLQQKIAIILNKYRFLNDLEYAALQKRSRAYLNTLSPSGLVGTRFFENMACKTLVLCEQSKNINNIFPSDCFIDFKSDFKDFDQKFDFSVSDSDERNKIVEKAYEVVISKHTWKSRVNDLINTIKN